jgi:Lon protease-like protein
VGNLDLSFDEASFSHHVPLFPLPGSVLLPGGLLPLHIFEARYREMVEDALDAEGLLAMALLRPGYEADYQGAPDIESHVCLGRINMERRLEDGRWVMLLVGLRRAKVVEEDRSRAYRLARVELVPESARDLEAEAREAERLRSALTELPPSLVRDSSRLGVALQLLSTQVPEALGLGAAVDLLADALLLGVRDRLRLLETSDVSERVEALHEQLARRRAELERLGRRSGTWPPGFSLN